MTDPWYVGAGGRYAGPEPAFFDPADFPWVPLLEENWRVIRDELTGLVNAQDQRLQPYFSRSLPFPPGGWKTMGLLFWGWRLHRNGRACPRTLAILRNIPHLVSASLSVLEPGANINPHQGDTNAVVRVHLGLVIPAGLPDCGFQVLDDIRSWQEGKTLLFCDAHSHTVWNQTDRRRLILLLDVLRPDFADQSATVCTTVLSGNVLQMLEQRFPVLKALPGDTRRRLQSVLSWLIGTARILSGSARHRHGAS